MVFLIFEKSKTYEVKNQLRHMEVKRIRNRKKRFKGSFKAAAQSPARSKSILKCVCLVLCLLCALPAHSAQRVALVIGNANYKHAPLLANPVNDAKDMSAALARLGFSVTRLENIGWQNLHRSLREFSRAAEVSEVAVVFYAGHGIEVDRKNYLIPVDAKLASDRDVDFEAVSLDLVLHTVEGASELRLVILDACRDNPFLSKMQSAGATRSLGRGLARVEPAVETLVAYAAKEGTVASDGNGRNSPYSEALLAFLEEPGLEVGLMFRKVRDAVLGATGGRQEPFVYGSLSAKGAYLKSPQKIPETAVTQVPSTITVSEIDQSDKEYEFLFWNSIKDSDNVEEYKVYLDAFPDGRFAALARSRLKRLEEPNGGGTAAEIKDDQAAEIPALNLSRKESRLIQHGLAALGFKPGPIDGLFGNRTRQAIESWQRASGHERTGQLLRQQADALMAIGEEAKLELERKAEAERQRDRMAPGQEFRDCANCPLMVVIPSGSFTMGSPASEEGRFDNEGPQHRVTIANPFAVGKYEVTFAEWDECRRDGGCSDNPSDLGHGRGNRPVVGVSWRDAKEHVAWLSRKTGEHYRLLSEAEWEYAARARTSTSRHWGEGEIDECDYANGRDHSAAQGFSYIDELIGTFSSCDDGYVWASPVGSFRPNGFGLHDVLGNVWEWVEDCWHDSYDGAPSDGSAWTTGGDCSKRILRGGSHWYDDEVRVLRSAVRKPYFDGGGLYSSGFRIARTLTP